jgi:hypothetical protein
MISNIDWANFLSGTGVELRCTDYLRAGRVAK